MPGPTETSASGRQWLPRERWPVRNPGAFLGCLMRSVHRCQEMERRGASPAEIGLAFYRALTLLLGQKRQPPVTAADRKTYDPSES